MEKTCGATGLVLGRSSFANTPQMLLNYNNLAEEGKEETPAFSSQLKYTFDILINNLLFGFLNLHVSFAQFSVLGPR
jgi:hypothetical protein